MPASTALQLLQDVFGYPAFRGQQAEIIEVIARGGDALVLMPTGGGKSLCYQIPALVRDGVGVVVSPLIALMQDQVDALAEVGVRAEVASALQSLVKNTTSEREARKARREFPRHASFAVFAGFNAPYSLTNEGHAALAEMTRRLAA